MNTLEKQYNKYDNYTDTGLALEIQRLSNLIESFQGQINQLNLERNKIYKYMEDKGLLK